MKDIEFITFEIIKACKKSTELNALVQSLYAKPMSYVIGIDETRDEDQNDYMYVPMITIDPMVEFFGDEEENVDYHIGIKILIQHTKNDFDEYTKISDNVIYHKGIFEIHKLYKLFYKAVTKYESLLCFKVNDIESLSPTIEFVSNNIEYWGQVKLVFSNTNKDNLIGACNG